MSPSVQLEVFHSALRECGLQTCSTEWGVSIILSKPTRHLNMNQQKVNVTTFMTDWWQDSASSRGVTHQYQFKSEIPTQTSQEPRGRGESSKHKRVWWRWWLELGSVFSLTWTRKGFTSWENLLIEPLRGNLMKNSRSWTRWWAAQPASVVREKHRWRDFTEGGSEHVKTSRRGRNWAEEEKKKLAATLSSPREKDDF